MNESTNSLSDEQKLHEGTETLQQIAEDVERERQEKGHSEFDETTTSDEQAIANASASSEENPDVVNEQREDHRPGEEDLGTRSERGVNATLGTPGGYKQMPH